MIAKARDDLSRARREVEDAVDLWSRLQAPFELARGRIALAEIALDLDLPADAPRELRLALAALRPLGAAREIERAEALLDRAQDRLPAV